VNRIDELHVVLMPPRSKVSLLSGAVSSSMLRGDSETECLLEELVDGAFNDNDPFFSERKFEASFHIFYYSHSHKYIRRFELVARHIMKVYGRVEFWWIYGSFKWMN
jgi:hypothetical protein